MSQQHRYDNWMQKAVMCFKGLVVRCVIIQEKTQEMDGRRDKCGAFCRSSAL